MSIQKGTVSKKEHLPNINSEKHKYEKGSFCRGSSWHKSVLKRTPQKKENSELGILETGQFWKGQIWKRTVAKMTNLKKPRKHSHITNLVINILKKNNYERENAKEQLWKGNICEMTILKRNHLKKGDSEK